MITLGLTGSIGMGKSTTAQMFRDRGIPVWDADGTVHALYAAGGTGAEAIAGLFPQVVGPGGVDRAALRALIAEDPDALAKIEAIIHPLVSADRAAFVQNHPEAAIVVFDIPLLFETEAQTWLDKVAVVSTDPELQRIRVLERPGMTGDHLDMILAKQVPDAIKRARADYVIDTTDLDSAARDVDHILADLSED